MLFPDTAKVVEEAKASAEKIVFVTHEHYVQPEARNERERTFGPSSWKRADGKQGSKTCDFSRPGVIAAGPGRGDAFRVCTDKKNCKAHWAKEQRESQRRADHDQHERSGQPAVDRAKEEAKRAREEERRRAVDDAVFKAIVGKVKWPLSRLDAETVLTSYLRECGYPAIDGLDEFLKVHTKPESLKPDELARALVGSAVVNVTQFGNESGKIEKRYKVDRGAIEKKIKAEFKAAEKAEDLKPKKAGKSPTAKKKLKAKK